MNTVKYVLLWLAVSVSLFCAGWTFSLVHDPRQTASAEVHVARIVCFWLWLSSAGCFFLVAEHYRKFVKWLPQEPDRRPIVRVWTHDGDTIITTDRVYRLSLELKEESLKAYLPINPDKIRVWPLLYTYQSNKRCDNGISSEQLKAILDSCSVQRTEMGVPMGKTDSCCDIGFERMWRLLHGPNTKLPATN